MTLAAAAVQKIEASLGFAGVGGMTNPSPRLVLLANLVLYDKTAAAEVTLGACTASPAWNGSGAPSGVQYVPRLIAPSIKQTVISGGQPGLSAVATWGALSLANNDGYWNGNNATGTDWLDRDLYEWRRVTLRVGVEPDSYSDFDIVDLYRFAGPPSATEDVVLLEARTALLDTEVPAYDERYPGFDAALNNDNGASGYGLHVEAGNSDQNIALNEDARWRFRMRCTTSAAFQVLWSNRTATVSSSIAGFSWFLHTDGSVVLRIADGTTEYVIQQSGAGDGIWHDVQAWIDRDTGLLKGQFDGVAFSTDADDVSGLGAVAGTGKARLFELLDGTSPAQRGAMDEVYFATGFGIAYPADLRRQHREGPASPLEAGAQYVWHMDEDNGTVVENAYDAVDQVGIDLPINKASTGTSSRGINLGDNYDKTATDSFTVVVVARCTSSGSTQDLIKKKSVLAGNDAGWALYLTGTTTVKAEIADGSTRKAANATTTQGDGVVRAYVIRVDRTAEVLTALASDSSFKEWTSAEIDISGVTGSLANAENLLLVNGLWGDIYSASIYSSALSVEDLSRLVPTHPSQADEPTLDSHWPLNEGTGTTATDSIGSIDGTIGGGASWVTRNGTITPGTAPAGGWIATLTGSYVNGVGGTGKPQVYGQVATFAPVLIDHRGHDHTADGGFADCWVYEWHDGPDDCEEITTVTEGGVAGVLNTDYKVSSDKKRIFWDVATTAPNGPIRITGKGAKFHTGSTYSNRLGLITREWLTTNGHLTTSEFPAASATDFDEVWPYPVGVYIRGGQERPETVGDVLKRSLPAPGLFWSTDLEGATFLLGRSLFDPDTVVADITITDKHLAGYPTVKRLDRPVYRVRLAYAEQVAPLSEGEFLSDASVTSKDKFGQRWSYAVLTSDTVSSTDGREITVETPLIRQLDALEWGRTILEALDGGMFATARIARHLWQVYVLRAGRVRPDVVHVRSSYAPGLTGGKNLSVLGVNYSPSRANAPVEVELELWSSLNSVVLLDDDGTYLLDDDGLPLLED